MVEIGKLDDKTVELENAKTDFARQKRAPLLNLARSKGRRASKKYWSFVTNKLRKSGDIPSVVDSQTGALVHEPEEISKEIRRYLVNIFSGHDTNPCTEENSETTVEQGCRDAEPSKRSSSYGSHNLSGTCSSSFPSSSPDAEPSKKPVRGLDHNQHPRSLEGGSVDPAVDPQGFLDQPFSLEEIKSIINNLKCGKAAGHDEIPNEALKGAPESFLRNLRLLYNRVKDQSEVPRAWKRGRVVLIFKSGDENNITNYRPITVLTSISSTYSKLLDKRLRVIVENQNTLGESQNGFRKDRSGEDSAFVLHTILWKAAAKQKKTHLAFLDVAKAYDTVDRDVLWTKLKKLGIGGKFLKSLQNLYNGDHVTCCSNGTTTHPVFLGRGLRQGCSLSPILFALYIVDLSREVHASNLGVTLRNICVSILLFADDIVLISNSPEGLRHLQEIVQKHVKELKMKLSVKKSKVMSCSSDLWEILDEDEIIGCLEKVLRFKYLGIETCLSPAKTSAAMMRRATNRASSYKGTCMRLAYDGPDVVDLALSIWNNIAIPSLLFGCEFIPFSSHAIQSISRTQSSIGKFTLGLPVCAPNVASTALLGIKPFKQLLFSAQLKFFVKVFNQPEERWSRDALMENILGGWRSPYIDLLSSIKSEVGMFNWPSSFKEVDLILEHHFLSVTNKEIKRLDLPALEPLTKRRRMDHVNESTNSEVYRNSKILSRTPYSSYIFYIVR